jgi:tetratricopeptide (TPR) repeat protein
LETLPVSLLFLGRFEEARGKYCLCLEHARESKSEQSIVINFHQLGMVSRLEGKYEEALGYYQQERELIERFGETDARFASANRYEFGYNNFLLGKMDIALSFMKEAYELAIKAGDKMCEACACRGLGEIHAKLDNPTKAKNFLEESIRLFEETGNKPAAKEVRRMVEDVETG